MERDRATVRRTLTTLSRRDLPTTREHPWGKGFRNGGNRHDQQDIEDEMSSGSSSSRKTAVHLIALLGNKPIVSTGKKKLERSRFSRHTIASPTLPTGRTHHFVDNVSHHSPNIPRGVWPPHEFIRYPPWLGNGKLSAYGVLLQGIHRCSRRLMARVVTAFSTQCCQLWCRPHLWCRLHSTDNHHSAGRLCCWGGLTDSTVCSFLLHTLSAGLLHTLSAGSCCGRHEAASAR